MRKPFVLWIPVLVMEIIILLLALGSYAGTKDQNQNTQRFIAEYNRWDKFQLTEADSNNYTLFFYMDKDDAGTYSEPFFCYDRLLFQFDVEDTEVGEDSIKMSFEFYQSFDLVNYFKVCDMAWWTTDIETKAKTISASGVYHSVSVDSCQLKMGIMYGKVKWTTSTGHKKKDPDDVKGTIKTRGINKVIY